MGLGNSSGNLTYVNLKDGKFIIKKDGQAVLYDHVFGYLRELRIESDTYNNETFDVLILTIIDGADKFLVKMKFGSGYCLGFCMAIGNADLAKKIVLLPSYKKENGKEKRTMFISQSNPDERGKALKWTWTKDNPGNLPQLKKVNFQGQDRWDSYEQNQFLKEYLIQDIGHRIPPEILTGPANQSSPQPAPPSNASDGLPGWVRPEDMMEPIDDLPF